MSITPLRTTFIAFTILFTTLLASGSDLKAMPIFFDLELTATDGPRAGTIGSGSFSIDGNLFSGTGQESFAPTSGLLSFNVSFAGFTFDSTDDGRFPDAPLISFTAGLVSGLDFFNSPSDPVATFGIFEFEFAIQPRGGEARSDGVVAANRRAITVAEPASLAILGLGLLTLGGFARSFRRQ